MAHSGLRPTAAPPSRGSVPQAARELAVGVCLPVGHTGHQLPHLSPRPPCAPLRGTSRSPRCERLRVKEQHEPDAGVCFPARDEGKKPCLLPLTTAAARPASVPPQRPPGEGHQGKPLPRCQRQRPPAPGRTGQATGSLRTARPIGLPQHDDWPAARILIGAFYGLAVSWIGPGVAEPPGRRRVSHYHGIPQQESHVRGLLAGRAFGRIWGIAVPRVKVGAPPCLNDFALGRW